MDISKNNIKYNQIKTSSSHSIIIPKYKSEDLVFLINNLNYNIKAFYLSIKQCLIEGKKNINNKISSQQILGLIEKYLNDFIDKAKDIFKKMKFTQKICSLQQEINEFQNNRKLFREEMINNKMKFDSKDIYLNSNNINSINNLSDKNNFINKNEILIDEVYIPNFCNNSSTSIKINNYIDNNINNNLKNIKEYNDKNYKKINNHSYNNKKLNINDSYGINYNLQKKNIKNYNNAKNLSEHNIKNYTRQLNNSRIMKNNKIINNLRKKILVKKKSLNNISIPQKQYYSSNNTLTNFYSTKKEILNNLNGIISILKELKSVNGNIFKKSWEAEEHQKLLKKIYCEINNLVMNIFKEQNVTFNTNNNNSLYNENEESGNNSDYYSQIRTLSKNKEKKINNTNYNLTYNYKSLNNNEEGNNCFDENQKIKKTKIYYDNEIKSRELIIKKLKNDLNLKEKNLQNQNIKYTQLLKAKLNNINSSSKEKNFKKDNLGINKMPKMDIEELIESRKLIIEMKEKIKCYEKILKETNDIEQKKGNIMKFYELLNKKYNDLKKSYDLIKINNEKLKKQINLFSTTSGKNISKKAVFQKLLFIKNETFTIFSNEESKKIIDEIKNELQLKNENLQKQNDELKKYKSEEIKLKEEISKLNNENIKYKSEENKLKEEISKLTNENTLYKEKEIELKQEISKITNEISKINEEMKKIKIENEILKENNNNNLEENKSLKETIDKQKKLLDYQDKEIISLQNKKEDLNKIKDDSYNNIIINEKEDNFNYKNKDDKKTNKRNNLKRNDMLQIEQDKIVLKYELLKNDYNKLNSTLQQKQKLLDNYSKLTNETSTKTNIDEQILELISKHKKEIDDLTKKYNQNIINLKMNLPINYSPSTHNILIDKKYTKYNLKWFLLTITTDPDKNYENTFWVPEDEIKPMLGQFNKYKTEKELEDEQFESIYLTQQKWIKQIDENEQLIDKLRKQLHQYENSSVTD